MSLTADDVVQKLQPGMDEYGDNSQFYHWMDYACQLDEIALEIFKCDGDRDVVAAYLNGRMEKYPSAHAIHHACTDVATTLESLIPEYKGVFKYV